MPLKREPKYEQRVFGIFHDVKIRQRAKVGNFGEAVMREFFQQKTPAEIAHVTHARVELIIKLIEKVTGERVGANTIYAPTKKEIFGGKRKKRQVVGKGSPVLYGMIERAEVRVIDWTKILRKLTAAPISSAGVTRLENRRRRENDSINISLEAKKRRRELEARHKKYQPTGGQRIAIEAIKFVIAYPKIPSLEMSLEGTVRSKGFVCVKDLTDYLVRMRISKSKKPREYVSKLIMRLEEEGIVERVPPGGIIITKQYLNK